MTIQVYPAAKSQVTSNFWRYTAVGGETTLSGVDSSGVTLYYYPNQEQVFLNGVLLVRGVDYTATSGTSITGLASLVAGDTIQVNCYSNFTITQVPVTALQGSITNLQLANSSITIGGQTINLGGSQSTFSGITLTTPTLNNPVISTTATGAAPLTINGIASQTGDYLDIKNSSGTTLLSLSSVGKLTNSGDIAIVGGGNIYSSNTNSTWSLAGGNSFNNGGSITLGGSTSPVIAGGISFQTGTGSTNTEAMRIDSSGYIGIGTSITGGRNLTVNGNSAIWGQMPLRLGEASNTYYYDQGRDSTTGNYIINGNQTGSLAYVWQSGGTELARISNDGGFGSTYFKPNQTLTLTSATTYAANTAYSLGTISLPSLSAGIGAYSFFCQLYISMDNTGYHTYVGAFVLALDWWKASGTTQSISVVLEQHNGNNANATITLPITGSSQGSRAISFQTDQSITVASGGSVTLLMKRMF